ncbi:MAG: hypothetical protein K8F30_12960, partial [Taibaiella sp.]|nr:hypothetical protein [Taibaiella sp.]
MVNKHERIDFYMTSKERLTIAMTGGIPDRVPVLPQITVPHAIRVLEGDRYIEGMIRAYEDPMYAIRIIYSVVEKYGADGMRVPLYVLDEEVKISEEIGKYIVYYKDSGRRVGTLDMLTGNIV